MKRLFLSLPLAALACAFSFPAHAQAKAGAATLDDFSKELRAFQQKNPAPAAAPAPKAQAAAPAPSGNPIAAAAAEAGANTVPSVVAPAADDGASPLGPAANLPVGKQRPATANALGMAGQGGGASPEQQAADKARVDQMSFDSALKSLMPLSPDQVRKVLDIFKDSRQASETPIFDPKPKIAVETVSLDPDAPPPVIQTSIGRITTLVILDATGAPWPIQDVSWAGKFNITPPEDGGHVVRITPDSAHNVGNLSIRLVDLNTPVIFTLKTGGEEVDYRFDARIPRSGPLAKPPLIENGGIDAVVGGDEKLVQILDGTPPGGAEKLTVRGADGRTSGWRVDGRLYLRTPLTLLSPTWSSSASSADGMNVYVLGDAPVIILSDGGRMVRASIASAEEVSP